MGFKTEEILKEWKKALELSIPLKRKNKGQEIAPDFLASKTAYWHLPVLLKQN